MRIVGGRFRGKRLAHPEDKSIRPSADRLREAIFNMLAHGRAFKGTKAALPIDCAAADVFAGTGALGLEALSRGAQSVTFVEKARTSCALIRRNVRAVGAEDRTRILERDARAPGAPPHAHDLVFLDAPYGRDLTVPALAVLAENGWLAPGAVIVTETGRDERLDPPAGFALIDDRAFGRARVLFLRYEREAETDG